MKPFNADIEDEAIEVKAYNARIRSTAMMSNLLCLAVGLITAGLAGYVLGGLVAAIGLVIVSALTPQPRLTLEQQHAAYERANQEKTNHTSRNLIAFGVLLIFLAMVVAFLALRADTTVPVSIASNARHVVNISLLQDQNLMFMVSGFLGLGGLIMIGFGSTAKR